MKKQDQKHLLRDRESINSSTQSNKKNISTLLHTYLMNEYWRPVVCVKQKFFEQTINKMCSLLNTASFPIGQLFEIAFVKK